MPSEKIITLGQLLDRAISSYDQIVDQPAPNDEAVQSKIFAALADLSLSANLISRLAILSPNETLEDISTKDLKCLAVDALRGLLETLLKTKGGGERKKNLERAQDYLNKFCNQVENYEIIPTDQVNSFKGPSSTVQNPAMRRESKINQFKWEKKVKHQLDELRNRQKSSRPLKLPPTSQPIPVEAAEMFDESDDENNAESRSIYLTWVKYLYIKAHQELDSIQLELDLLGQAAQMNDLPSKNQRTEDDLSWRLDKLASSEDGPFISPTGKVLRPFTILPSKFSTSSASTSRLKLRAEVFRPDWNLPTMTIDEYLDEQKAMGNFLSGGGPNQADQPKSGELARIEAEEDNMTGEIKSEELRKKAMEWNEFTDSHRKGEGNMMNRG